MSTDFDQIRKRGEKIHKKSGNQVLKYANTMKSDGKYIKCHEGDQSYDLDGDESRAMTNTRDPIQMQNMPTRNSIRDLNHQ